MTSHDVFSDLTAVSGVRAVILFEEGRAVRLHRLDDDVALASVEAFARGLGQIVRKLDGSMERIDLQYAHGRFIVRALGSGIAVALLTNKDVNLPLLALAFESLARVAREDSSALVQAFQGDDLTGLLTPPPGRSVPLVEERSFVTAPLGPLSGADEPSAAQTDAREVPDGASAETVTASGVTMRTDADLARELAKFTAFAVSVLGRSVIANYWRQNMPSALADRFTINVDAGIQPNTPNATLSVDDWVQARAWVGGFVGRCAVIVTDFPEGVRGAVDGSALDLLEGVARGGVV